MARLGAATSVAMPQEQARLSATLFGINSAQMASSSLKRSGHNMGYVEFYNETTGEWTNIEDVPLFDTINCQLCNEPTEAHDIVAEIKFKDEQPIVGAWQCRKCKAVNG
mgnify:CR=1 FL=1